MCEWPIIGGVVLGGLVILATIYVFLVSRTMTAATLAMVAIGAFLVVFPYAGEFVIGGTVLKYKRAAVVAANLAAAEATRSQANAVTNLDAEKASVSQTQAVTNLDLGNVAAAALRAAGTPALSRAKVLWVDDNPDNNRYERSALGALGITFVLATSTNEALDRLKQESFNLVISDFKRRDDPQAAYTLLSFLKKLPSPPRFIIYSSSATPEFEREAKARGAYGETNRPQRLFDLSVTAILGE